MKNRKTIVMESTTGTTFIYKDAFNLIHQNGKIWEVAHPSIFQQLVSNHGVWRLAETDAPMLNGLHYTLLRVQTPLGLGTVWVFVEDPEMFRFPDNIEDRWNWWLQWGQRPILISCPILHTSDHLYISWTIRSTPLYQHNAMDPFESHDLCMFRPFYTQGCYSVASGQTLFIALHRASRIDSYSVLEVLNRWKNHYTEENQEMMWMTVFSIKTTAMLQHIQTNTILCDHLPLYACYGETSPQVLSFFLQSLSLLSPTIPHAIENPDVLLLNYLPYYIPLLAKPSAYWTTYWSIVKPFLPNMSVVTMRASSMYPAPTILYPPSSINSAFWISIIDLFMIHGDTPAFTEYIQFLQHEFAMGGGRMAHRMIETSFQCEHTRPIPKRCLYAYWTFVKETLFPVSSATQWMRWLGRFFAYYRQTTQAAIPWRFLHWLFFHTSPPPLLFKRLPEDITLFQALKTFKELPAPADIPALFHKHVLLPRIQARLRVFYQYKRTLSPELCDVFQAYLRTHRELVWI